MGFDFSKVSSGARERYIGIGRQFGSADTLAQANKTLKGLGSYGSELVQHGFSAGDAAQLLAARDGLIEEGVGRTGEAGAKKVTNQACVDAIRRGKDERESARSVVSGAARELSDQGGPEAEEAGRKIVTALEQTRSADDDPIKLAGQLTTLRDALSDPVIAAAALNRGGPQAVEALGKQAEALRAAAQERAGGPGTPAATERLDILDGIIVTLARAARKAARAASKRLGTPALLADFELVHLYGSRSAAPAAPAEPAPPAAPGGAAPAAEPGTPG